MAFQRGVFWGVVPYTPAAPFSVKFLWNYEEVETAAALAEQFRRQDVSGEVPFSVPGKPRPVLALSEPSSELREVTALRLANISRRARDRLLTEDERREVVSGEHRYLFPLAEEAVKSLTRTRETYAVVVDNPVTLHESAIVSRAIGEVTEEEFASICERFVEALQLDLTTLLEKQMPSSDDGGADSA